MIKGRITVGDIKKARAAFEANEPRDLFYRAATELVDLSLRGKTSLTVAEAVAVLLQTWNKAYYQYHKFNSTHFKKIETLIAKHQPKVAKYRNQNISELDQQESAAIMGLFKAFEVVLGPVGASKVLHLLAPKLFPLWDRAIAHAYGVPLGEAGTNGKRYWRFLLISQTQCRELQGEDPGCKNPLKSIDEFNYYEHTKGWFKRLARRRTKSSSRRATT